MNPELGVALSLASMLCFAVNILVSRYALMRMRVESGFFIVLAVNLLAGGSIFIVELAVRSSAFEFQLLQTFYFALGGAVGAFIGRRMLLDAVRTLGPARTSVFHSCTPLPTLLFAWIFVGETLGLYELALMGVVLAGLWITQPPDRGHAGSRADRAVLRRGALMGILAITGFGASNSIRGLAVRNWDEAIFGALVGALAAMLLQILVTRDWAQVARDFREAPRSAYALYTAGGFATLGGAFFMISAAKHMEIALAALITHTTPLVIFPYSMLVLRNGEGLTRRTFAGVALVLAGITLLAFR